jgi:uncharacterized membrane protein (UPF0127 family)
MTMYRFSLKHLLLLAITFASLCSGCEHNEAPPQSLRTTRMVIAGTPYTLEVADNPDRREIGLMKRDSMPADHGMIFIFPGEQQLGFWMKNTRIPLDIIYLDASGKIVSTATMKPYDLANVPSGAPAKYAIELNEGQVKQLNVKPGDVLSIPPDAREPEK